MSRYMEWVTQVFAGVLVGVMGAGIGLAISDILTPEIEEWAFQQLVSGIYGIAIGYSLGAPLGVLLASSFLRRQGRTWLPFLLCALVLGIAYLLRDTVLFFLLVGQPIFATLGYSIGSLPRFWATRSRQ
jgi:MFS family permease